MLVNAAARFFGPMILHLVPKQPHGPVARHGQVRFRRCGVVPIKIQAQKNRDLSRDMVRQVDQQLHLWTVLSPGKKNAHPEPGGGTAARCGQFFPDHKPHLVGTLEQGASVHFLGKQPEEFGPPFGAPGLSRLDGCAVLTNEGIGELVGRHHGFFGNRGWGNGTGGGNSSRQKQENRFHAPSSLPRRVRHGSPDVTHPPVCVYLRANSRLVINATRNSRTPKWAAPALATMPSARAASVNP